MSDPLEVSSVALRRVAIAGAALFVAAVFGVVVFVIFLRKAPPGPIQVGTIARGETFALEISRCPEAGGEAASGSIRNDTDRVVSFRIELPFVDVSGTELSRQSVVVEDLRPLEASIWTIGPAPAGTIACVGDQNEVFYEKIQPVPDASN